MICSSFFFFFFLSFFLSFFLWLYRAVRGACGRGELARRAVVAHRVEEVGRALGAAALDVNRAGQGNVLQVRPVFARRNRVVLWKEEEEGDDDDDDDDDDDEIRRREERRREEKRREE